MGILLRARKHKLVEFEGEMLFQRRDDDVPIFLLKPIHEIRRDMESKIESIKRCGSPAPQATSVLLDKKAHGLDVPKGASPRSSVSRTPSPQTSKGSTPVRETKAKTAEAPAASETPKIQISEATKPEVVETKPQETPNKPAEEATAPTETTAQQAPSQPIEEPTKVVPQEQQPTAVEVPTTTNAATEIKTDVNNNSNNNINNNNNDIPTIIIEATAVYEGPAKTDNTSDTTTITADSESNSAVSSAPAVAAASS